MTVDREQLADFLKTRREALQPEDVGLPRGARRRTHGLRREEVAALAGMSTDYYSRLEQRRSKQPSEPMLGAIARALHLTLDERDHLFRLSGHNAPHRVSRTDHVNPGLMRVLDRLQDNTPAQVMTGLGETLLQTPLAVALLGTETEYSGMARSIYYRWFTNPDARRIYPTDDHPVPAGSSPPTCATPTPARDRSPRPAPSSQRCSARAPSSPICGAITRSTPRTSSPNASSTPNSASSACSARSCSTPTNLKRCWCSPRPRAPTATTGSSCSG